MGTSGPLTERRGFCTICSALCGIVVALEGESVVEVRGDPEHPVSRGYTCPKGRALGRLHHHPERLGHPQLRRRGELRDVSWDECLEDLAGRITEVLETAGPDGVGMYLGTGSSYDANGRRLAERFLAAVGSRSKYTTTTIDEAPKPYVAELMSGHPGLVPAIDFDNARLVVFIGANPVVSHGHLNAFPDPVAKLRGLASRGELWVLDPRRTETARLATRHLALRPGTDFVVLGHLVRELLRDGADRQYLAEHARDVDVLARAVERFDLATAAARSGLDPTELTELVAAVRRHGRVAAQTGTGTTMSAAGNVTEWLVWALHVVTGSYDRPGGMWFNPGYLRRLDARRWPPGDASPDPGPTSRPELPSRWGQYPCAALADEVEAGNLRALFVVGGSPLTAFPEPDRLTAALRRLDVLVHVDILRTDTSAFATHSLACDGPLERANLPHHVDQVQSVIATQYSPALVALGADRKPMWWIFAQLGRRLGHQLLPGGRDPDECTDDELLGVIADRGRSSFAHLKACPTAVVSAPSTFGWVLSDVLPEGRWRIAPAPMVEQLDTLADPPPLVLIPRRQLRHMNAHLRDVPAPGGRCDLPDILIHPLDAAEAGVLDGQQVTLTSLSGQLTGTAKVDEAVRRGAVSVPHGFAEPNVTTLTSNTHGIDPLTGMVHMSGVPVSVTRADSA